MVGYENLMMHGVKTNRLDVSTTKPVEISIIQPGKFIGYIPGTAVQTVFVYVHRAHLSECSDSNTAVWRLVQHCIFLGNIHSYKMRAIFSLISTLKTDYIM